MNWMFPVGIFLLACLDLTTGVKLWEEVAANNSRYILPAFDGNPLIIDVLLELQQLIGLDVKGQSVTMNLWVTLMWKNPNTKWDPIERQNIESLSFFENDFIWLPDLYFHEQTAGDLLQRGLKTPGNVWYDGYTTVGQSMSATFYCNIRGDLFPFDQHVCTLTMESWNYFTHRLLLRMIGPVTLQPNENDAWEVLSVNAMDNLTSTLETTFGPMEYSRIQYHFLFKRRSIYYEINVIFPGVLISFLQLSIFILPCESGEKVSFGVTIFLSQIVNMMIVNNHIPEGGKTIPVITKYLSLLVTLNAGALLAEMCIINLHFQASSRDKKNGLLWRAFCKVKELSGKCRTTRKGEKSFEVIQLNGNNSLAEKHNVTLPEESDTDREPAVSSFDEDKRSIDRLNFALGILFTLLFAAVSIAFPIQWVLNWS